MKVILDNGSFMVLIKSLGSPDMKVIGSGFAKTGTTTLCHALRILGFKTYHIEDQFWYLGDQLIKALDEGCTTEDFREMFKDVDAVTDLPSAKLWEELHKAFPDAKIVHCERDSDEEWTKSFKHHQETIRRHRFGQFLSLITPTGRKLRAFYGAQVRVAYSAPMPGMLTLPAPNYQVATMRYREHNSRVKQAAPKDQTLIFHPKDGWEPLCKFLGVPVPDEPFPHLNKKGAIVQEIVNNSDMFKQARKELTITVSLFLCFCAFVIYKLTKEIIF